MPKRPTPKKSTPKKSKPETPKYDAATAARAFESLKKERAAVVLPGVLPRLDMQAVAALGVGIADDIRRHRARFENLAKELDGALVDRVGTAAWALWHAAVLRQSAMSSDTEARVSAATLSDATALRERMLKVTGYYLSDDAAAAAEIADVRAGAGYADLAADLTRLAALYTAHTAVLRSDKKLYDAGDARRAGDLAARIVAQLGASEKSAARRAAEEMHRAYVVLDTAYRRVRLGAALLFDGDGFEERYPSLFSVRASPAARPQPPPETKPSA